MGTEIGFAVGNGHMIQCADYVLLGVHLKPVWFPLKTCMVL